MPIEYTLTAANQTLIGAAVQPTGAEISAKYRPKRGKLVYDGTRLLTGYTDELVSAHISDWTETPGPGPGTFADSAGGYVVTAIPGATYDWHKPSANYNAPFAFLPVPSDGDFIAYAHCALPAGNEKVVGLTVYDAADRSEYYHAQLRRNGAAALQVLSGHNTGAEVGLTAVAQDNYWLALMCKWPAIYWGRSANALGSEPAMTDWTWTLVESDVTFTPGGRLVALVSYTYGANLGCVGTFNKARVIAL